MVKLKYTSHKADKCASSIIGFQKGGIERAEGAIYDCQIKSRIRTRVMHAPSNGPAAARKYKPSLSYFRRAARRMVVVVSCTIWVAGTHGTASPTRADISNIGDTETTSPIEPVPLKFPSVKVQAAFNSEMNFIEKSMLSVFRALVRGNFEKAGKMADNINRGHMLSAELSQAEMTQLANSLPPGFKKLDAKFHAAAARLKRYILIKDLGRALDSYREASGMCIRCHRQYATHVFPFWKNASK